VTQYLSGKPTLSDPVYLHHRANCLASIGWRFSLFPWEFWDGGMTGSHAEGISACHTRWKMAWLIRQVLGSMYSRLLTAEEMFS